MDNIILCHIAGLNNSTKQELIKNIIKFHNVVEVIDFDMITKIIYKSTKFKTFEKKKQHPQMVRYWEKEFNDILQHNIDESKKNNKKIICIGSNVYARSRYVNIQVDTPNLFFLNTPVNKYVKQIISHNIQAYSHEIIDGTFPLKFIQHEFLSSQRTILEDIHKRLNYKFYSMDEIINNISQLTKNKPHMNYIASQNIAEIIEEKPNILYFTSPTKYNNHVINNANSDLASLFSSTQNSVIAYKQKWMALLCSELNDGKKIDKQSINITTNNKDIVIKELNPGALRQLHKYVYLYEVSPDGFENTNESSPYKYRSTSTVEILNTTYISDVGDELSKLNGIKLQLIK